MAQDQFWFSVCMLSCKPKSKLPDFKTLKNNPIKTNSCCVWFLQLGMLIPAGIPEPANVRTSREVKSGRKNLSFSNAAGQGRRGSRCSAWFTSSANLALISLLTTATKPTERSCKIFWIWNSFICYTYSLSCGERSINKISFYFYLLSWYKICLEFLHKLNIGLVL